MKFWHEFCSRTQPRHRTSGRWSARRGRGLETACRLGPGTLSWGPPASPRPVTAAWEGAREEAYEQKKLRHAWNVTVRPVEAGCGGFVATSTCRLKKVPKKEGIRLVAQRERDSSFDLIGIPSVAKRGWFSTQNSRSSPKGKAERGSVPVTSSCGRCSCHTRDTAVR